MPTFKVYLTRTYSVTIDAQDETAARELVEFFVGGSDDVSNEQDRLEHHFHISEIETITNDAFEAEPIANEEEESTHQQSPSAVIVIDHPLLRSTGEEGRSRRLTRSRKRVSLSCLMTPLG